MLYDKLMVYTESGMYPMHMPGHKRNADYMPPGLPFDIDITEIHGFDDLHDPQGVLLETTKLAAEVYGSLDAFILVGGSTVGILAAIGAHTKRGDKILAGSNCHRSTPNAAELFGLELVYVEPGVDRASGVPRSIKPSAIESALESDPDIKLVIITSPTYEGVVSDVAAIADVVHGAGIPLVVDSAHGAHLGFSNAFPQSAIALGADVVVVSLHKTLSALTQSSLLHVCSERADTAKIKRLLSILQTSSPSYILMASIDHCLRQLKSDKDKLFSDYERNLAFFSNRVMDVYNLVILYHGRDSLHSGFFDFDTGKIVVVTKNTALSGMALSYILRDEYMVEVERVYSNYLIAMTSICDRPEGIVRLADALCAIDARPDVMGFRGRDKKK